MPTATRIRDHCLAPGRAVEEPAPAGGYRRLFPELDPLDRDDPAKLLVGRNDAGRPADLPRNPQGVALIGDPRNDVHLLMSQLHVAMLHLHNGLVDRLRGDGVAETRLFAEARRAATWHYQWVLLEDFLPRVVGAELAAELLADGL